MSLRFAFILTIFLYPAILFGANIDSLKNSLEYASIANDRKAILQLSIQLGKAYSDQSKYPEALVYFNEGLEEAKRLGDNRSIADAHYHIGFSYHILGEYPKALDHLLPLVEKESNKTNKEVYEKAIGRIGYVYLHVGEYKKASMYLLESLASMEEKNDFLGLTNALYSLGSNEYYQKNYAQALEYYKRALSNTEHLKGNTQWRFTCLIGIGNTYRELERFEEALDYLNASLSLAEETGSKYNQAYSLLNLGGTYLKSDAISRAVSTLSQALEASSGLSNKALQTNCLVYLGNAYMKAGDYEASIKHLEDALAVTSDVNAHHMRREAYKYLAEAYAQTGNMTQAYDNLDRYITLKDSLFGEEKQKEIEAMKIKFDVAKKESQIALLQGDKEREMYFRIFIAVCGLMLLGMLYMFYSRYRLQQRTNRELENKNDEIQIKNEKLASSNAALEQFAYVASHDLNEPLRMISAYTQLLDRRYRDQLDENAGEFMDFINDSVSRMRSLLKDLLDLSRVTSRKPAFKAIDLNETMDSVVKNLGTVIKEQNASITYPDMPEIVGSKTQMLQLFQNLVGNAVKFRGEEDPIVKVSCDRGNNGSVVIAVQDNGIGIDEVFHKRIFQVFHRLHTSTEYEGTGLGLAICKKIVENHDGKIWVESEVGEGSVFYVKLPLSPASKN